MKKLLLPLLLSASAAWAGDVNLGLTFTAAQYNADQKAAVLYGRQLGTDVLRQIAVDANGAFVPSTISAATSGAVGITSTPSLSCVSFLAYTVLSQTATVINVTSSAGASVPCVVCLSSNGGPAAGFKVQFPPNATPRGVTASVGHYIAASTTAQCWGPFQPGTHIEAGGVAAVSSVLVDIQTVR